MTTITVAATILTVLHFTKMNGAGNDFILIDNRTGHVHLDRTQIACLCDRHRGIGADGILLLEKASNHADFRMRYFNADGGEVEMCGNGARCFARFANQIAVRTYERGVEAETLACGTGIVASALVFAATENATSPVTVIARGGDELRVGFEKSDNAFRNVTLTGPAEFVFEGSIEI